MTHDSSSSQGFVSPPIVFIHIFKAAGTSVQLQIRAKYGQEAVPKVNDGPGFAGRVATALQDGQVQVLAGHFRFKRITEALGAVGYGTPRCFSFLRDPVERIVSAYNYFQGKPAEKWYAEACSMDINDFIRFLLENDPESIVNHQCKALSENAEPSFDAARANIEKNFAFLGCMEHLSKSNAAAQSLLGIQFDAETRRNESVKKQSKDDISGKVLSLLHEATEEDRKLYDYIRKNS